MLDYVRRTSDSLAYGKIGGMNLKAWREEHRLSQAQLARLLEVDQMTISRWERGAGRRAAPGKVLELALAELERRLGGQEMSA
jgi:transcriptional regulator with XRE-family HTH domain